MIYQGPQSPENLFFRVLLFKLFNRIETWQLLEDQLGVVSWEAYSFSEYDRILTEAFLRRRAIYSPAYIIPSPQAFGYRRKHRNHLALLEALMRDNYPKKLQNCKEMQEAFHLLCTVPSFGHFLAYQHAVDLNYTTLTAFSENDFVVPGPGALSGLRKCFSDPGDLEPDDLIRMVTERQEDEFTKRGLEFEDLWGRSLQLVDCQNLFCEVDKYARLAHPEFTPADGRQRIKQRFRHNADTTFIPWFPPDWGLNVRIATELSVSAKSRGDVGSCQT